MRAARSLISLFVCAAFVLVTSAADAAQTYSFAGKFTSNRGKIINIPMIGNTKCTLGTPLAPAPTTGGTMMLPVFSKRLILKTGGMTNPTMMTVTPALRSKTRGANTQPPGVMAPPAGFMATGMDLLCVKHAPNIMVVTNASGLGTAMGKGGGFVFPNQAFYKPQPNKVRAVAVKYVPPVIQLATSFKITGPRSMRTTPPAGTLCAPTTPVMTLQGGTQPGCGKKTGGGMITTVANNIAPFHRFVKSAWKGGPAMTFNGQTGRAGAMFTWCPFVGPVGTMIYSLPQGEGGPCTKITQGGAGAILKYTGGGPNDFGGTMAYVITTGAGVSSLALGGVVGPFPNAVLFQRLAGMGSQPTGRGYADFLTDMLDKGPIWGTRQIMVTSTTPVVGPQTLITMVGPGPSPVASGSNGYNYNWGFPLTTGTVLVRNTNAGMYTTLSAMGYDKRATPTAMGNRNISLVAGGIAIAVLAQAGQLPTTPEIMSMFLPEPAGTAQILAGVIGLLGIAAWRARKVALGDRGRN